MSVNQAQVDHIITAASEDDPDVKFQNLEREVDLIKTTIKRLLMDIRERMNELENPFTIIGSGNQGSTISADIGDARKSAIEAREAALDARESHLEVEEAKREAESRPEIPEKTQSLQSVPEIKEEKKIPEEHVLAVLKVLADSHQRSITQEPPESEKPQLQKVHKLFRWTNQAVRKFGHDRVGIMLESFCVMGYVPRKSANEIREISRLMPADLGEEQEVSPDEFVYQIYTLNRIIAPHDLSLDRDLIEVMMEQRQQQSFAVTASGYGTGLSERNVLPEKRTFSKTGGKDDAWMNLPV